MWRKIFKIFGARVVMTIDMDGEIRFRFATETPAGLTCRSIYERNVICNADGSTSGCGYVRRWYEV